MAKSAPCVSKASAGGSLPRPARHTDSYPGRLGGVQLLGDGIGVHNRQAPCKIPARQRALPGPVGAGHDPELVHTEQVPDDRFRAGRPFKADQLAAAIGIPLHDSVRIRWVSVVDRTSSRHMCLGSFADRCPEPARIVPRTGAPAPVSLLKGAPRVGPLCPPLTPRTVMPVRPTAPWPPAGRRCQSPR